MGYPGSQLNGGEENIGKGLAIKEDKAQKEQAKKERKYKQQQQIEAFFKCKEECTCGKNVLQPSFKNVHVAIMF